MKTPTRRSLDDASTQSIGYPFNWLLEHKDSNQPLFDQIENARDKNLPQNLVESIADGIGNLIGNDNEQTDCIKLLVCKSAPIIWGMQRAITERIQNNDDSADETNQNNVNDNNPNSNKIDEYFRHLPNVTEFKNHGDSCELRYKGCKTFPWLDV